MRGLALTAVAVLAPLAAVGQERANPEPWWNKPPPEHASTYRWVCLGLGDNIIEFRIFALPLNGEGPEVWMIRHGQTFLFAVREQRGLESIFAITDTDHEIHIGADRVARYYTFSGKEGELLQASAVWMGCKETR